MPNKKPTTAATEKKPKAKPDKLAYSETFVETAPLGTWKEGRTK